MLKAHCILYYKSGMRAEHFADSQREIEKVMEQAENFKRYSDQ